MPIMPQLLFFVNGKWTKITGEPYNPSIPQTLTANSEYIWDYGSLISERTVDLMLYINSKLVNTMRHIHKQVENLFSAFQVDRCLLEQKIFDNYLTLATTNPVEFSFQFFGGPGYTAVARGEVIHISQCKPIVVQPRVEPNYCYSELPVYYNNASYFLTPRNWLLVKEGTKVVCISGLESFFKLQEGKWFHMTTMGLARIPVPQIVNLEFSTFRFEEITSFYSGGCTLMR